MEDLLHRVQFHIDDEIEHISTLSAVTDFMLEHVLRNSTTADEALMVIKIPTLQIPCVRLKMVLMVSALSAKKTMMG